VGDVRPIGIDGTQGFFSWMKDASSKPHITEGSAGTDLPHGTSSKIAHHRNSKAVCNLAVLVVSELALTNCETKSPR
jgi:hypothetical protein